MLSTTDLTSGCFEECTPSKAVEASDSSTVLIFYSIISSLSCNATTCTQQQLKACQFLPNWG